MSDANKVREAAEEAIREYEQSWSNDEKGRYVVGPAMVVVRAYLAEQDTIESLRAEVAKLRAEQARLVEALGPLGEQAEIIDYVANADHMPPWSDDSTFRYRGSDTMITLGHCRRIAQVLREIREGK